MSAEHLRLIAAILAVTITLVSLYVRLRRPRNHYQVTSTGFIEHAVIEGGSATYASEVGKAIAKHNRSLR